MKIQMQYWAECGCGKKFVTYKHMKRAEKDGCPVCGSKDITELMDEED
jgi:rRNA maturation endonuclease Nob1